MRWTQSLLMLGSMILVCFIAAGALVVNVGAPDSSERQAVLFAEVLSLVMDNYVDPVEAEGLLEGAYESMLNGLDPNGAYLSPAEVEEWRASTPDGAVDPGMTILKLGRTVQVVAVAPGSSAEESGIEVGDQLRTVDGRDVQDLSLAQARRLLLGRAKSRVKIELVRPSDDFGEERVELIRDRPTGETYEWTDAEDVTILRVLDLSRLDVDGVAKDLAKRRSPGRRLLVDLRNVAGAPPRDAVALAGLLVSGGELELRRRDGQVVESVRDSRDVVWDGDIAVLTNRATADGGEALATLLKSGAEATVYGEGTFGLGAEVELLPLENGGALLISTRLWSAAGAESWHGDGLEPDETVRGKGDDYAEVAADQLEQVLARLRGETEAPEETAAEG